MVKAYTKTIIRQITFNFHRYFSILLIVALGVSFYSGLRSTSPNMQITANDYLSDQNVMDFNIVSQLMFTSDDVLAIKENPLIKGIMPSFYTEAQLELNDASLTVNVHSLDTSLKGNDENNINQPNLLKGRFPDTNAECLIDEKLMKSENFKIGDQITLAGTNLKAPILTIVGVANSPLYISIERGVSSNGDINGFILVNQDAFNTLYYTNLYVTIDKTGLSRFSKEYKNKIQAVKKQLETIGETRSEIRAQDLGNPNLPSKWIISDLFQNIGFSSYLDDTQRISAVGNVFPLIFFLVSSLVSLTSMTRMVENDRTEIGIFKSLGYSRFAITRKYLFYALSASIIGGVAGFLVGVNLFPKVIFNAYGILYHLMPLEISFSYSLAITSILAAILVITIPAYFACLRSFVSSPANLMRPKAPDPGKRIFLEKINFLWTRLKFIQKVTARNLFRYKKRLLMTVIGIAGCTALLLTGFGLRDSISSIIDRQFKEIRTYDAEIYLNNHLTNDSLAQFKKTVKINSMVKDTFYIDQESLKISYKGVNKDLYLIIPENATSLNSFITLRTRLTHEDVNLDNNSVVLTEKIATLLGIHIGDTITLENNQYQIVTVKVSGIVENYLYHYVYMSPQLYESLFNQTVHYNVLLTKLTNTSDSAEKQLGKDFTTESQVQTVHFISQIEYHFNNMISTLNDVVYVLIISAALLAFLVLFTLTNINIDERKRELATIKVLGFYDKEVSSYIYRENFILTFIGIIAGLILGYFLLHYVIVTTETDIVMFCRNISWMSYINAIALTFVFAIIVNVIMHLRIHRIDMIESLKNVE